MLSFAADVTEQVSARAQSDALARERMALADELEGERRRLEVGEERFRSIVETHADIVWVADWNGQMRHPVPGWCALTGQKPEEMLGLGWVDAIHPDDLDRASQVWSDAVEQKRRFETEFRIRKASGGWAKVASRGIPLLRGDGQIREWVGTTIDVTTRHREEEALRILSGGAAELSNTLDYQATLRAVGEMAIPTFADICIVDLMDDSGQLRRVEVAGRVEEDILEGFRRLPPRTDPDSPVMEALRTRRSVLRERLTAAVKLEIASQTEHLRLFERISPTSLVCAPLSARGRTLGVISFLTVRSGRRFERLDLGLVEELARRAALAMDNAVLYQRAEDANRAKDEFLATVSHELRTPLASILGWTRLLRRGGLAQEKQSRALETLERNARAQTRLVEDLLDVSRIVSGKTRLNVETADLARIVESAVESIRPGADSRGIQLQASVQPCTLAGDPERLQQVLWNLLSNAVKFTPRGGRVSVSMEVRERTATVIRQRHRSGHPSGLPAARLRALPAGRRHRHPRARGARARPGHRAPPGGAPRRNRHAPAASARVGAPPSPSGSPSVRPSRSTPRPTRGCRSSGSASRGCGWWWWTTSRTPGRWWRRRSRPTGQRSCRSGTPRRRCAGSRPIPPTSWSRTWRCRGWMAAR